MQRKDRAVLLNWSEILESCCKAWSSIFAPLAILLIANTLVKFAWDRAGQKGDPVESKSISLLAH